MSYRDRQTAERLGITEARARNAAHRVPRFKNKMRAIRNDTLAQAIQMRGDEFGRIPNYLSKTTALMDMLRVLGATDIAYETGPNISRAECRIGETSLGTTLPKGDLPLCFINLLVLVTDHTEKSKSSAK